MILQQSEIAKDYLKKKEALKILDVNMFLLEAERIKNQLVEVDEKIKIADFDFKFHLYSPLFVTIFYCWFKSNLGSIHLNGSISDGSDGLEMMGQMRHMGPIVVVGYSSRGGPGKNP